MSKRTLKILLICIYIIGITGCSNNLSKKCVGTWKNKNEKYYFTLYEGGTGYAYSDKEEFEATGYAPQPLSWEVKDDIINITYTLADRTEGYKYNKNTLTSVDEKSVYIKEK